MGVVGWVLAGLQFTQVIGSLWISEKPET